jgi:hypothetical protein
MLLINSKDQIEYDIDYLKNGELKTLDDVIKRYESSNMHLFYHVISSPTCRYESKFGKHRISKAISNMSADERFINILKNRKIVANPKSFFVNKTKAALEPKNFDEIRSVSFTLSSISDLVAHFEARDSQYAICFFHDFLQDKGIRRVQYINDYRTEDIQRIVFSSPHLIEIYSSNYDMRWEAEWRIKGDLRFTDDDVAFLIVPDSDYKRMVDLFSKDEDLSGYVYIIPGSTFTSPVDHLFQIQNSDNLAFGQVPLFRQGFDDELLMDTDEFPELLSGEREAFERKAGKYLRALAKSTIHDCYENRFVNRFIDFIEKLDSSNWEMSCIPDINNIKKNLDEPWQSHRDLTIVCYETLFTIQQSRIVESWDM